MGVNVEIWNTVAVDTHKNWVYISDATIHKIRNIVHINISIQTIKKEI